MEARKLTPMEIAKRREVLNTVAAIRRGGDYSEELSRVLELHSRDGRTGYRFSNVAARAMQVNISPLVMLGNGSKCLASDADDSAKELAGLYRRLDIALALGRIESAETSILKIRQLHDKIMMDNPKPSPKA
jgi:hypothetical protein